MPAALADPDLPAAAAVQASPPAGMQPAGMQPAGMQPAGMQPAGTPPGAAGSDPGAAADAERRDSALGWLRHAAGLPRPAFSTSFGAEDMVLLDLISRHRLPIAVFTIDTGRLPEETHRLMQQAEARYGRIIELYFPDSAAVQALIAGDGYNGFYHGIEQRHRCCDVRKVEPLGRALAGRGAWVTGQRAAQSQARAALAAIEPDPRRDLVKVNPLHDWSEAEVWRYLQAFEVPVNELHARHYPSIGCAPCTRAITPGEDIRAGRWWWEQESARECGLHARPPTARVIPARVMPSGVMPLERSPR
ncbi:MAG: phosphoadenylyl-sulfate reductase [Lautropia sp.]